MNANQTYIYYTDASYSYEQNCYSTAFTCNRFKQKEIFQAYFYHGDEVFKRIQSNGAEIMGVINVFNHIKESKEEIKKAIIYFDNYIVFHLIKGKTIPSNYIYLNYLYLFYELRKVIEFRKVNPKDRQHKKVDKLAYRMMRINTVN